MTHRYEVEPLNQDVLALMALAEIEQVVHKPPYQLLSRVIDFEAVTMSIEVRIRQSLHVEDKLHQRELEESIARNDSSKAA